ncbi:MAG: VOC family protein [Mycobacteriales bacterium]
MPDVAFKDLCLDALRPELVGPFWAALLGLEAHAQEGGDYQLRGEPKERTVWVNRVPEPLAGKSRVHLDVRLPDPLDVPGATVVRERDAEIGWRVLADPDGAVLCAFGPHPEHPDAPPGAFELVVDAADPLAIATWWADRTGATVHQQPGRPWVWLEGAAGFPYLFWVFNPVPEPKTVKSRVHWDVTLLDAGLDDLLAVGATLLRAQDDDIRWSVLADPEGNEFCAFSA